MPDPHVNRNSFLGAKLWEVGGVHGKEASTDLPDVGLILPPTKQWVLPPASHGVLNLFMFG